MHILGIETIKWIKYNGRSEFLSFGTLNFPENLTEFRQFKKKSQKEAYRRKR